MRVILTNNSAMAGRKPGRQWMRVGLDSPPHKDEHATETTARDLTSSVRRSEADNAIGLMRAGNQNIADISTSIADVLSSSDARG